MRCDEENHWGSRTVYRYLMKTVKKQTAIERFNVITPPHFFLERLAQLLAIPTSVVMQTTYWHEFVRLTSSVYPWFERGRRMYKIYFCPECIARERLLRRTLALPHIMSCPQHYLMLQNVCRCGNALQFSSDDSWPFTCPSCSLDLGKLPRVEATPSRVSLDQKFQSYYSFFFSKGTPELFVNTLQFVNKQLGEMRNPHVKFYDEDGSAWYPIPGLRFYNQRDNVVTRRRIPLGRLIYSLVKLGLSVDDIMAHCGYNRCSA